MGAPTWLARGLKIQESQIALRRDIHRLGIHATELQHLVVARRTDRLSAEISAFLAEAKIHISPNYEDELPSDDAESDHRPMESEWQDADENLLDRVEGKRPDQAFIPLPSNIGHSKCIRLRTQDLVDMELQLRIGQANDVLQQIWLGVAEKAVLFHHGLRPATGYLKKTRAWGRVHAADDALEGQAMIYRKCREAMVKLDADEPTLARYQILCKEHLNAHTSATNPNARGLRYEVLPWYFNLDIQTGSESSAWMLECKAILPTYIV